VLKSRTMASPSGLSTARGEDSLSAISTISSASEDWSEELGRQWPSLDAADAAVAKTSSPHLRALTGAAVTTSSSNTTTMMTMTTTTMTTAKESSVRRLVYPEQSMQPKLPRAGAVMVRTTTPRPFLYVLSLTAAWFRCWVSVAG
jgi:hypothetical protein